jgi:hypothetical protein
MAGIIKNTFFKEIKCDKDAAQPIFFYPWASEPIFQVLH